MCIHTYKYNHSYDKCCKGKHININKSKKEILFRDTIKYRHRRMKEPEQDVGLQDRKNSSDSNP